LNRVLIPLTASTPSFAVADNQSPFHTFSGEAKLTASFWALPAAPIDIANPTPAEGIGAIAIRCEAGLASSWTALNGGPLNLRQPYIMAAPGWIAITDLSAGNAFCVQKFALWKDKLNPFGTTASFRCLPAAPFFFNSLADGTELISTHGDADVRADRPVTAKGEPLEIRSKNSLLILAATRGLRLFYLFDDNILADQTDLKKSPPQFPKPLSLVLSNALFKTTAVNGALLFGNLARFRESAAGRLYLARRARLPYNVARPGRGQCRAASPGSWRERACSASSAEPWLLLVCGCSGIRGQPNDSGSRFTSRYCRIASRDGHRPDDGPYLFHGGGWTLAQSLDAQRKSLFRNVVLVRPDYDKIWADAVGNLGRDQSRLTSAQTPTC
jgi:hypothetical protein